jgi:hypothetical protein
MELNEYIKQKRSTLAASSVVKYTSILRSLYYRVIKSKDIDTDKFNDSKTILEYLKDIPANKRKTILIDLVIITDNDKYRSQMNDDVKKYNEDISTNRSPFHNKRLG